MVLKMNVCFTNILSGEMFKPQKNWLVVISVIRKIVGELLKEAKIGEAIRAGVMEP